MTGKTEIGWRSGGAHVQKSFKGAIIERLEKEDIMIFSFKYKSEFLLYMYIKIHENGA